MAEKPDAYPANFPPTGVQQISPGQPQAVAYPPQYTYNQMPPTAPLPQVVTTVTNSGVGQSQNTPPDPTPETPEIYKIAPHVEIAFEDTFKESGSARGFSFMNKVNSAIYKYTLFGIYASFSLVFGPIFAFIWAIAFAFIQISIVWFVQPFVKTFFVMFRVASMLGEASIRLFLDPFYRSMSLILSGIKGRFSLDDTSVNLNMKTKQIQNA